MTSKVKKQLATLPQKPGIYLFKNSIGNVLYVGKAKSLSSRVRSYFRQHNDLNEAKQIMVRQIVDVDWIETKTESDAIILEDKLIKDYQPRFNVLAKDDKSFLYIHITDEKFPQVLAVRRPNLRKAGIFYGPYPFARSIREVLKLLHNIFPYRTCKNLPKKACLEYYIYKCKAPCINKISESDYQALIYDVLAFFEGRNTLELESRLEEMMQVASEDKKFEDAAKYRDQLKAIKKLRSFQKTPREYLTDYYQFKAIDPDLGLQQLQDALVLPAQPKRVEVYDISNIQGTYAVGSMVVFIDGLPARSEYRRFKIKTVQGADDYKSLQEVVRRRLKRDWPKPDLAIMDGGKGQLNAVKHFWQDHDVSVVALAKKREELFLPDQAIPITMEAGSQGLFLIQRMRDEAHRFAITYYRKLHSKSMRANTTKS
ncbi:MAG: excinuclease ABC subunit UvrC [bacterium]|nr:excinuclease ABC subunit UvrC [bacterium]